jgi:hypothetical protein
LKVFQILIGILFIPLPYLPEEQLGTEKYSRDLLEYYLYPSQKYFWASGYLIHGLSRLSKFERGSRLREQGPKTNKINVFRVLSEFFSIVVNFTDVKIFFENSKRPLKALKVFFLTKR